MGEKEKLKYRIGVTLLEGVGPILAKKLIAYCGGAEAVFLEKSKHLMLIPGIGPKLAKSISNQQVLHRADRELSFIDRNKVHVSYYLDKNYPGRLKNCEDSPILLYVSGDINLNHSRTISVVGTRNASNYGKGWVSSFLEEIKPYAPIVLSGLAYGIDICAHRESLKFNLPTGAVLAHGLDRIYPMAHKNVARQMMKEGGALITEFLSETQPDRENFPRRNRIVAGLSDAVLVVESDERGGAIITADLANSYHRDVFAVPGPIESSTSRGCNKLIKSNRASLIECAKDIEYIMGWEPLKESVQPVQQQTLFHLSPEEKSVVAILQKIGNSAVDQLVALAKMPAGQVNQVLLQLECSGVVRSLPGRQFSLK